MEPDKAPSHLAGVTASALLTQVPMPDVRMAQLLRSLVTRRNLDDAELEEIQSWALRVFSENLIGDEPTELGRLADSLLGQVEVLKSTWK